MLPLVIGLRFYRLFFSPHAWPVASCNDCLSALRRNVTEPVITRRDVRHGRGMTRSGAPESVSTPNDGASNGPELDTLFSATYEELRRLASSVRRSDPAATASPTTLVSEAWLKLERSPVMAGVSSAHFKRIAARAMRQVLIEAARRRHATKRGNAQPMVTFDESIAQSVSCADDLVALDEALNELARLNPRQSAIVEHRFFGGFDVASTAEALGISEATVLRDWRSARAWLALELGGRL